MHTRIPPLFKVSLLAVAIVMLHGCAASKEPAILGDAIVGAGQATAQTSKRAFEGTKRLFGFGGSEGELNETEVDLALQGTNQGLPANQTNGATAQPVQIGTTEKIETIPALPIPLDAPAIAKTPAIDPNAIPVATVDQRHIVGPNETMWTIAKLTTGDPNNWRILAEINQLDLNTPMQIGQEIFIPADLVIPPVTAQSIQATQPIQPTQTIVPVDPVAAVDPTTITPRPISQEALARDPLTDPLTNDDYTNAQLSGDEELQIIDETSLTDPNAIAQPELANNTAQPELTNPGTVTQPELAAAVDPTLNAVPLTADVGETLWDVAKRTTGDATNWKSIAAHNGFTEQDINRIRYGQTIYVPEILAKVELGGKKVTTPVAGTETDLAKQDVAAAADKLVAEAANATATAPAAATAADTSAATLATAADAAAPATDDATAQAEALYASADEAISSSASLVASAKNLMDEPPTPTEEIKIVEATYQSDEAVQVNEGSTNLDPNQTAQTIKVSGTYYPKAVYNEADFSSSLLMRVSPGTEMTVTRATGPWYEVETEFGRGFMHARDIK